MIWYRSLGIILLSIALVGATTASAQSATVEVCGTVTAYVAPSAVLSGLIVIGGQSIPIAAGTSIDGSGSISVGADLCLHGTLNVSGQLVAPSTVTANATASIDVCGVVSAYAAATASTPGSITIDGRTLSIAAGTALEGAGLIRSGASLCLHATVNGFGQVVAPSSVTANATATLRVCGVVTAYTEATASAPGSLTIGDRTIPIAAGTSIDGSGLIAVGANLCLSGTLDASGRLVAPSSVTVNALASVQVCGVVTAFTAATASAPGSITIGGQSFPIAVGTNIQGQGSIQVGTDLCLNGTVNAAGQLVAPTSVTVNATTSLNLCGVVTAFTPATATAPGSITIAGRTFSIAAGTVFGFPITVGQTLCSELVFRNGTEEVISGTPLTVGREIVFPVAANVIGLGGAHWQTDLRIVNIGDSLASATLEWYPFSPAGQPGPAQSVSVNVAPGVQESFDQAIETLFGTEGGGSLRLVSASTSLAAAVRLYHEQRDAACGGAFGTFEKGLVASESVSRGVLPFLANMPGMVDEMRSNLGYFNASAQPVEITFQAYASDGRLIGAKTLVVPGFATDQKNVFDIIDTIAPSDRMQHDMYVKFQAEGGLPFVYGSAVFNSTNDALFATPWQY